MGDHSGGLSWRKQLTAQTMIILKKYIRYLKTGIVSSGLCCLYNVANNELFLSVSTTHMEMHGVCLMELTEHCMI